MLGIQYTGAFILHSILWSGKQHTSLYYSGGTEPLLEPDSTENLMRQLFAF